MKGYLTTCDGVQYELPTLLKWEFSYTGSVPCDSFTLRCAYEPAMAETLRRAVRFTAKEDGAVEFAGVVDECGVTCDEKGLQLEVSGRGMAALLLDNEAESVSYQWATMEEILKNHVAPYGIVCTGYDAVTAAARYRVANGSSQWKALNDFAALHGGIAPYFDKTGALEIKRNRKASCVNIDEKTPVTALAYCDKRYGVIAEALVVDSKAGAKQRVKNEAFCDRGGTSRRVFYVPARSGRQMMRYTGGVSDRKIKGGRGNAACDGCGEIFGGARGSRACERDKAWPCRRVSGDRVRPPLRRERRNVRSDDAEGVKERCGYRENSASMRCRTWPRHRTVR